jgi:hypothetical protein
VWITATLRFPELAARLVADRPVIPAKAAVTSPGFAHS